MKNKIKSILSVMISIFLITSSIPFAYSAEKVDITPPSDVEGIKAKAGDKSVTLTWEAATDDTGVTAYRIYYGLDSVTKDGGEYMYIKDVNNVVKATIEDLEDSVDYYFALTALDAAGNESEFYSVEVSGTPTKGNQEEEVKEEPKEEEVVPEEEPKEEEVVAEEEVKEEPKEEEVAPAEEVKEEPKEEEQQIAELLMPLIANFVAKVEEQNKVRLSWKITQGGDNLSDQIFYQSEDGKVFSQGLSIGNQVRDYLVSNLIPGKTYTFKLTAKDLQGKETEGVVTSITLPQTGAGLIGLSALSLLAGAIVSRKKK